MLSLPAVHARWVLGDTVVMYAVHCINLLASRCKVSKPSLLMYWTFLPMTIHEPRGPQMPGKKVEELIMEHSDQVTTHEKERVR